MTLSEFDQWTADINRRFPSVSAWAAKCFPSVADRAAFQRTWFDVLREVAIADALEVNRLMQAGDIPWVGEYDSDKERLPQHIRRLTRNIAAERNQTPAGGEYERPRSDTDFPAGKLLRRWSELQALGTPREEARQMALDEFPVGNPKWEPRYSCLICLDIGMVSVASNAAIQTILTNDFEKCHHRIGTMRCSCRGHVAVNPKRPIEVYDQAKDFKIVDFMWGESETARFREWVEFKREEFWNAKRTPEFDRFNQREFAK